MCVRAVGQVDRNEPEGDRRRSPLSQQSPEQGFYHVYMAHNTTCWPFGHDVRQSNLAINGHQRHGRGIPSSGSRITPPLPTASRHATEVLVRFGAGTRFSRPRAPDYLPIARALRHCARGIATPLKAMLLKPRRIKPRFSPPANRFPEVTASATTRPKTSSPSAHVLAGEILYREGQVEAFDGAARSESH